MPNKTATHAHEKSSATVRKPHRAALASRVQPEQVNPMNSLARVQGSPASELSASDILSLQRTAGNRAVGQILAQRIQHHQQGRLTIQAKLTVGAADDHYEREADRVAATVVQTSAPSSAGIQRQMSPEDDEQEMLQTKPLVTSITPLVQRQEAPEKEEEDDDLQTKRIAHGAGFEASSEIEGRLRMNKGGGHPLPADVRSFMEPRFGADFADVRVHADGQATELNHELRAQAFTQGSDIYFREGSYSPRTESGMQLLAHELTHVVQQRGGRSTRRTAGLRPGITRVDGNHVQRRGGYGALDEDQWKRLIRPAEEKKGWFARKWDEFKKKHWSSLTPDQQTSKAAQTTSNVGEKMGKALNVASHPEKVAAFAAKANIPIDASPDAWFPKTLGGIGGVGGVLGATSGLISMGSGIQNIRHELKEAEKNNEPWWKRWRFWSRGVGRTTAGLAQTTTGVATAVKGFSAMANASNPAITALSSVALPAQIAMSAVDTIKGGYKLFKGLRGVSTVNELQRDERGWGGLGESPFDKNEVAELGDLVKKYHKKRAWSGLGKLVSGLAAGIGGVLTLTGVGGILGIPLMIAGGLGSAYFGRKQKKALSEEEADTIVKRAETMRSSGNFDAMMKTISPEFLALYKKAESEKDREIIIRGMLQRA